MIRVLVADDSATARALLLAIFSDVPDVTVVAEARDGVEAVELADRLRPDLITMDVHMPRLDGLEATRVIMTRAPAPILIVTGANPEDLQLSFEATSAGALMVIAKPSGRDTPEFAAERRWLIDMVRAMARVKVVRRWPSRNTPPGSPAGSSPGSPPVAPAARRPPIRVIAIAASTGGPAAVRCVLDGLPAAPTVPVVVVQHIARGFTDGFARWLGGATRRDVRVARDGELLDPGVVYVAPDDRHLGVAVGGRARVSGDPAIGGFRPSADRLFSTVAEVYGGHAAAVILTGMGRDGVEGLRAVRAAHGYVVAQDEASCVVYGMPYEAVRAGLTDRVLPVVAIGQDLARAMTGEE